MPLIKSISGMRGTIGGTPGDNLTPIDIIEFTSAFGAMIISDEVIPNKVVVGRDGRISGPQIQSLIISTLQMMGIDVIDLGLSTTPTVEMEVKAQEAGGGVIITASHNPMNYNALKFLNEQGDIINKASGLELLEIAKCRNFSFAATDLLGTVVEVSDAIERHVGAIMTLPTVDESNIRKRKYKVVIDCINSTGAISMPVLCKALDCEYILINESINGTFAHNPEPLEHNLVQLSKAVLDHQADLGIAVDPDVDRLAFVDEKGIYCGEEYTLVMVADYILSITPGATVSNLSSTKALRDVTELHRQSYYASAVGEVNVVNKMREVDAVIGGEGNGGIIFPALHSGRDALVGVALLLSALSSKNSTLSEYRAQYPNYIMVKNKIQLTPDLNVNLLLAQVGEQYKNHEKDTQDGLKIYIDDGWVHMRKSNTEPIIRIYTEGKTEEEADKIAKEIQIVVGQIIG